MRDALAVLWHYAQARRRRFASRAALEAWQDRQVQRHVEWVRAHAPFYAGHWRGLPDADWRRFPEVDRVLLLAHFADSTTTGTALDDALAAATAADTAAEEGRPSPRLPGLTAGLSSGTSGRRGVFLASAAERHAWAGTALARLLPRPLLGGPPHRAALFLRAGSALYDTVTSRRVSFGFFDLSETPEAHVEALNRFNPTVLIGPPAVLRRLAEASELTIEPERVVAGADVLDSLERDPIERRWGAPVHQVYQATEGFLAATCPHGTLHLNEDVAVIEQAPVPDLPGCFVPILTDFRRTTQPLVRYRLDDVLRLRPTPCPCGLVFTALERIEGRLSSLIRAGGREVAPSEIHAALVAALPGLADYRVVQDEAGAVHLRVVGPDGSAGRSAEAMGALLGGAVSVTAEGVDGLPLAPSGKLHRVVSQAS